MKVTELAKTLGVTADTVRYYTRIGLLTPVKQPDNGYKYYSKNEQRRLQFILNAKQLGFTVADIQQILDQAKKGETVCPLVRKLIEHRLEQTERQFKQTQRLRARMQQAVEQWQSEPDMAPTGEMVCHLIEQHFVEE